MLLMTTYKIHLSKGGVLEVEATPLFLTKVAEHYEVSTQEVTALLIKDYFEKALENAIDKASNSEDK